MPSSSSNQSLIKQNEGAALPSLFGNLAFGALALWLLAAPSQFSNHWPMNLNFWSLAMELMGLAAIALLQSMAGQRARLEPVGLCLLLFLGWNLLATQTSVYRHDSWLELARITGCIFVFFAVRAQREQREWLAIAAVIGALYPAVGALVDFFLTGFSRQFGGYLIPNMFAAMLTPALLLSLLLPILLWQRTRSVLATACGGLAPIVLLLALAVTGSKGGLVAAVIGLFVFLAATIRAKGAVLKGFFKRAWPILLVAALIFGFVGARSVGPRLLRAGGSDSNSTQFRVYLWKSTVSMIEARPLVGFGPETFSTVYPQFAIVGPARTAHQSWLQIAAEGGAPALLLLLSALILAVRSGWQLLRTAQWVGAACGLGAIAGVVAHGMFDAGWSVTPVGALLCVALALCTSREVEPESVREQRRQGLNLAFLTASLVLILGGYGTQKVAVGEDLRAQAEDALRKGLPSNAPIEAVQSDPGSASLWNFLARMTPLSNRDAWEGAFRTAAQLQPNSASHPRAWAAQLAYLPAPSARDIALHGELLDKAVLLDPLNSSLRLERSKWRLGHKDERGFDDLEFVLQQWDKPYGQVPALGTDIDINLDFARATLAIAPRLKAQKQTRRLENLVARSLADVAIARTLKEANTALMAEMDGQSSFNDFVGLDELDRGLKALNRTAFSDN